ncbi:MAG: hypothetical protein EHM48_05295 [Planctomycetaceae bacterium]|nr:MAG: hypothetical protein EHM48_05295 [Planctomycetaceae bacterium]
MAEKSGSSNPPDAGLPTGFKMVYAGLPLVAFYAAEMIRPLIGKTIFVRDSGNRTRSGELKYVPNVREDSRGEIPPVEFIDERPLFLREIVCIGVYERPK